MTDGKKHTRINRSLVRPALGALSGLLAVFGALAVTELVAAGVRPQSGPVIAVGDAAIVEPAGGSVQPASARLALFTLTA
ncbi:hypothetical protein [Streptomyces sp. NPDC047070]|uniref:hypothetical protein n=1 Tax=Streptomyces sp. NPDC047070 TaxID=3154923 RepID=UPI00345384F6